MAHDEKKLARVRERMRAEGLVALLLRIPENVSYISDLWPARGLSYVVLPADKDPVLIHPAGEYLPQTWLKDVRLYKWESYEHLGDSLAAGAEKIEDALSDAGIRSGRIGIEEEWENFLGTPLRYEMSVIGAKTVGVLRSRLAGYELRNASQLLIQSRSVKTEMEVQSLKKANRTARAGLETFERNLKSGLTEVEVSSRIESTIVTEGINRFRANRVIACAFVASGRSTAEAYKYAIGNSRRRMRRGELVMLELDVVVDGYSSDTTRTFVVGRPNKQQRELLEAVLDSEKSAISAISPGVRAADVARISNKVIERHGLSKYLVHRLGHGIGVAVHEPIPALHIESEDALEPGMVHSVEPGIYGEKIGGIRIEDDILDTAKGYQYLSNFPRLQD